MALGLIPLGIVVFCPSQIVVTAKVEFQVLSVTGLKEEIKRQKAEL